MKAETTEKIEVVTDLTKFEERAGVEPEGKLIPVRLNSPTAIMQMGAMGKWDPKLIMDMLEAQKAWDAHESKKAFARDMALFKKDPPEILKTAHVSFYNLKNQLVEWDHAELGKIAEAINERLADYNFFANWDWDMPDPKKIKTTCKLTHAEGHSESVTMWGPPDTSGNKDELKAAASTNTILQRLTLLAVVGLAAKGIDKESPIEADLVKFITPDQAKTINDIIAKKNIDIERFLVYAKAEKVEEILESKFKDVKANLDKAKTKEREPGKEGE